MKRHVERRKNKRRPVDGWMSTSNQYSILGCWKGKTRDFEHKKPVFESNWKRRQGLRQQLKVRHIGSTFNKNTIGSSSNNIQLRIFGQTPSRILLCGTLQMLTSMYQWLLSLKILLFPFQNQTLSGSI